METFQEIFKQRKKDIQQVDGLQQPKTAFEEIFKDKPQAKLPPLPDFPNDFNASLPPLPELKPTTEIQSRPKTEQTISPETKIDWAEEDGKPKKKKSNRTNLPQHLSPDQVETLIKACQEKSPLHGLFCRVLWVTGVRSNEALQLTPQDLLPDKQALRIRWQKSKRWNQRLIPCEPLTFQELQRWAQMLAAGDRFFPRWTKQNAATWMAKTQKECGFTLTRYGCHVIRHSYASFLYGIGTPLAVIQELLGHSSPQTTAIYSHLNPQIRAGALGLAYERYAKLEAGLTHTPISGRE